MKTCASNFTRLGSLLALPLLVSACGGPEYPAQVGLTLQTVISKVLEASAGNGLTGIDQDSSLNTSTILCGADSSAGTVVVDNGSPYTIFVSGTYNLAVTFNSCQISVCNTLTTLTGTSMTASVVSTVTGTEVADVVMTLTATNQVSTGAISGTNSFGYIMRALIQRSKFIDNVIIQDKTTPAPLTTNGLTVNGSQIEGLSEGC